jgi:hypothetical protein
LQSGVEIVQEYTDRISGVKARRPGLDQLMADGRRSRFDVVLVWASGRIAPGEHEDRHAHGGDLLDQILAFRRSQFHRMPVGLGRCAAMHAGQIAGLGHLPDGDERPLVEVDRVQSQVHD